MAEGAPLLREYGANTPSRVRIPLSPPYFRLRRRLFLAGFKLGSANRTRFVPTSSSDCGFKSKENRETQAKFVCKNCGLELNADANASRNILAVGRNLF